MIDLCRGQNLQSCEGEDGKVAGPVGAAGAAGEVAEVPPLHAGGADESVAHRQRHPPVAFQRGEHFGVAPGRRLTGNVCGENRPVSFCMS